MKITKEQNGITLIALVITIIVLLILAGVAISQLTGGNILNNAQSAVDKYNEKVPQEEALIGELEDLLDQYAVKETDASYFSYTVANNEATITGFSEAGQTKYNAGELTELILPSKNPDGVTVTTIGNGAFSGCQYLRSVKILSGVKIIGAGTFYNSGLISISLPDNVTSIGQSSFSNCTNLADINLSKGMTTIPQSAFNSCTSLKNITIPNNIVRIESWAFGGCSGLLSVGLSDNLNNLLTQAFGGCSSLKNVKYKGTEYKKVEDLLDALDPDNNPISVNAFDGVKLAEDE